MAEQPRRLVVFDFDGTLADTWRDIATALNETLVEVGLPEVHGPDVRQMIGDGARKLLLRAVPPARRTPEEIDALYARFALRYEHCFLDTTELYPGMAAALDELADAELAIASNKPTRFLEPIVAGLGLKDRFRVALGGDALDVKKPDPRVVHSVVERVYGSGTRTVGEEIEVWMIGDSAVDIATGRDAGAGTIGCAWGLRGRDELRAAEPDFLLEDPTAIPAAVLGRR